MVGIAEASATVSSIKAVLDMAKGLNALKTATEVNQAVIDIQRALLEANEAAFSDRQTIADLRQQVRELEAKIQSDERWTAERERYVLTCSSFGAYTYDLRPEFAQGEVFHRLCAKCFESGIKSILHTTVKHSGGEKVHCSTCKSDLLLANFNHEIRTVRNDRGDRYSGY